MPRSRVRCRCERAACGRPGWYRNPPAKLRLGFDALPFRLAAINTLPNCRQRFSIRMPDSDAEEHLAWIYVQVVTGRVHILTSLVAKLDADVGFIGGLVFRETSVAVNAHQRSADFFGTGIEVG